MIFETGRIFGGDSCYFYIGDYKVDNNHHVVGDVRVTHHHGQMYSIFGQHKQFTLKLSGQLKTPEMLLQGFMVEDTNSKIAVRCIRRAELP